MTQTAHRMQGAAAAERLPEDGERVEVRGRSRVVARVNLLLADGVGLGRTVTEAAPGPRRARTEAWPRLEQPLHDSLAARCRGPRSPSSPSPSSS